MRMLVSQDSRDYIRDFFSSLSGDEVQLETQKINWCPLAVTKIMILATKLEIKSPEELFKICDTESVSFVSKELEGMQFQPILEAFSGGDEKLTLEIGSVDGFFRIGDLPFKSNSLHKVLSKYR